MREALRMLTPAPSIHIARDGEEASRFLARTEPFTNAPRPSLVFLDFHLPKTDPRTVLKYIRNEPALQNTAVVVLTTSTSEELCREAYSLGASCYLWKPADLDNFFFTVRSAAEFWLNSPLVSQSREPLKNAGRLL